MMNTKNKNRGKLFFHQTHLTAEGVSLSAEALYYDCIFRLPSDVTAHLEDCLDCKKKVIDLYQYLNEMGDMPPESEHPWFGDESCLKEPLIQYQRKSILPLLLKLASVIILLVISVYIVFSLFRNDDTKDEATNSAIINDVDVRTNFSRNDFLESMMKFQSRSDGVKILKPDTSFVFEEAGVKEFLWETEMEELLDLVILDNSGQEFLKVESDSSRYLCKQDFDKGLYYWMLSFDEKIYYVGKFRVDLP